MPQSIAAHELLKEAARRASGSDVYCAGVEQDHVQHVLRQRLHQSQRCIAGVVLSHLVTSRDHCRASCGRGRGGQKTRLTADCLSRARSTAFRPFVPHPTLSCVTTSWFAARLNQRWLLDRAHVRARAAERTMTLSQRSIFDAAGMTPGPVSATAARVLHLGKKRSLQPCSSATHR